MSNKKYYTINNHSVWIDTVTGDSSCDCVFSSLWKWSKHWQENYPNSVCKHVKIALLKAKEEKKCERLNLGHGTKKKIEC